ncbi:MAG TPA: glycosyltransferase [Candidatus Paceibacterota bacterium]|nr:glycosyltransferase [Candidatus Paceibacterota bacterium]
MKDSKNTLLLCTQVVDRQSTTLGFMHRWIEKLAPLYDRITVMCLYKGECSLPSNVQVYSLGKEVLEKENHGTLYRRIRYTLNFYKVIFSNFFKYEKVFVHMNQEYILLGGIFWRLAGKKVCMWRNHYEGNALTKIAGYICNKVFYTSRHSFTAQFKNSMQMPVGVDVESLSTKQHIDKKPNSILFLARLDPSKYPDVVLHALKMLQDDGIGFSATFVGGTSDKFPTYQSEMHALKASLGLGDNVVFVGAVPSTETYKYYLSHDLYVNASKSGMLDKTIFEALAAGCLPITTSGDFHEMVGEEFKFTFKSSESLFEKLKAALDLPREEEKNKVATMQKIVIDQHSLDTLVKKINQEV